MKDTFRINFSEDLKYKMLSWANQFNIFCLLDNCGYKSGEFDLMLAAGSVRSVNLDKDPWQNLQSFHDEKPSWLFGHISYEAGSPFPNKPGFNNGKFFEPLVIVRITGNEMEIVSDERSPSEIFKEIIRMVEQPYHHNNIPVHPVFSPGDYIDRVNKIREHIHYGDCYELNFCQEFYAEGRIDPLSTYMELVNRSPNPFSALYKNGNDYCLCASPERFLKKEGDVLISQPIKGTSPRFPDEVKDQESKNYLAGNKKERSENVMVVDLVRNDLGRVCIPGTVKVKELCGIYAFPQVYQMISTIEGKMKFPGKFGDAIEACFPMGSMTGAPKIRVMELIREFEAGPRGLFSGSIGYITPQGDFDLNVVIRSLFYDEEKGTVSFLAGGGITFKSDADQEYRESMLKAETIRKLLEGD